MMKKFKTYLTLLAIMLSFCFPVFAQEGHKTKAVSSRFVIPYEGYDLSDVHPEPLSSVKPKKHYVSIPGRFFILMPEYTHSFKPVFNTVPTGALSGMSFSWRMKEGDYRITYVDWVKFGQSMTGEQFLNFIRDALLSNPDSQTEKGLTQRDILTSNNPGREVIRKTSDGITAVRIILAGNRIYQLLVTIPKSQIGHSKTAIGVFDSFVVLSKAEADAEYDRRIAETTPAALPQNPAKKMLKTDAEMANLHGRVKSVNERSSRLGSKSDDIKLVHWVKSDFDQPGNLLKKIETEEEAIDVVNVRVYGFVDGDRVDRSSSVDMGPGIPVIEMSVSLPSSGSGVSEAKYDERYHHKIKYKYDDQNRLIEEAYFENDGQAGRRYVYKYNGNRVECLTYFASGPLRKKVVKVIDERGFETEVTEYDVKSDFAVSKLSHSYELDTHGNWVTRRTTQWSLRNGIPRPDSMYVTVRTITYY